MNKEVKIVPPEGYKIDQENSTFECIKFKPITKRWRDDENAQLRGYYISEESDIYEVTQCECKNVVLNYNVFATEKQAKSALAMARISQIMANDERFGGVVTDEEWGNITKYKFVIRRDGNAIYKDCFKNSFQFLAFHHEEQRDLFLKENEDLVKDYLMLT